MTLEELVSLSATITDKFHGLFRDAMKGTSEDDQRQLAALCLGKLLGVAYSTDVERNGPEAARRLITQILMLATGCAQMTGADPDFRFAIIEKNEAT